MKNRKINNLNLIKYLIPSLKKINQNNKHNYAKNYFKFYNC